MCTQSCLGEHSPCPPSFSSSKGASLQSPEGTLLALSWSTSVPALV